MRYSPPTRASAGAWVTTRGPGASHRQSRLASVHASNTSATGAAMRRTTTRRVGSVSRSLTCVALDGSIGLDELDEVAACIVEHGDGHGALLRRWLAEDDAALGQAPMLGVDVLRRELGRGNAVGVERLLEGLRRAVRVGLEQELDVAMSLRRHDGEPPEFAEVDVVLRLEAELPGVEGVCLRLIVDHDAGEGDLHKDEPRREVRDVEGMIRWTFARCVARRGGCRGRPASRPRTARRRRASAGRVPAWWHRAGSGAFGPQRAGVRGRRARGSSRASTPPQATYRTARPAPQRCALRRRADAAWRGASDRRGRGTPCSSGRPHSQPYG